MTDIIVWNGAAGTTTAAKTLSITAAVTVTISGSGTAVCLLEYTLDGSSWTQWFATGTSLTSASYTASIASGANLANVAVRASTTCSVPGSGSSSQSVTATITASNLAIA